MKRKISILLSALLMMQLFTFENPRVYADVETETNTIKVVTAFPEDTYTEVPVSTPIYLEFDREVSAGPGIANVTLKNASGQTVAMDYLIEGKEVVFYQTGSGLQYTSAYTINIPKDAIVDAEGNYMEADYVAKFTTDQEYTVLAGANRYETSLKISQKGWKDGSDYAVLATGANFPDALSAAPLAAKYSAPILLVKSTVLDPELEAELNRLGVKNVFIVGGTGVVSQQFENTLKAKGIGVKRLSGIDRYETSIAIARELDVNSNTTVFLTTGANFPDALSVAPIAAAKQMPIILTDKTTLPDVAKQFFAETKISKVYTIGGYGVVSLAPGQLKTTWEKRIEGANRYETNLNVLAEFADELSFTYTFFATGANFPDALAGSALAGLAIAPVILVEPNMPQNVINEFRHAKDYMNHKFLLGGDSVVPRKTVEKITK
ncbi:cell wall-binding repeat-containing protein [Clostridium thermarum]|uniref:cell wall-binding repeat-containing protein n=1 Tax=Clostridium thermarum TaxID=1716543 RepID=UPI0013D19C4B|nr:cell wall-binding repeat-containing protein [Clostridium thermarum]